MADMRPSIVVGAFSGRKSAEDAINALQKAGFQNDQIRQFSGKGTERSGLLGIKNIFTPERMERGDVSRDLMDLGVASEDIPFYQQEYEAGHPLVSVSSTKRLPEATAILLNHNAYIPTTAHASSGRFSQMQREPQAGTGQEQVQTFSSQDRTRIVPGPEPFDGPERMRTTSGQERARIVPGSEPFDGPERTRAISSQERARTVPSPESFEVPERTYRATSQERTRTVPGPEPFDVAERTRTATGQEQPFERLQEEQHMRLHAEQIRAYKQSMQVGEVILRKEVVTDQQTIDVPVYHEEIVIERRPITGELSAADQRLGEGQTIRIPVSEDRVNLTKQVVATSDVVVGKRERQEVRHYSDTVKHEEAHWEQKGDARIIWERGTEPPPPAQYGL